MSKIWTAEDLSLGKLTINRVGGTLHIERRYKFLDANGDVITQIATGRLLLKVKVPAIPPLVLAALQAFDTWTKDKALEQEEMS